MLADKIFEDHQQYLNDIAGIDFTRGRKERAGWKNPCEMFCGKAEIGIIRAVFSRYFTATNYKISYLHGGKCKDHTTIRGSMHKKKALELGIKDYEEGYIAVKVSFANIPFTTLIPELSHVLAELKHKCVVLHDLDIAVDCAYISTR
ncbi:hypothetical protein CU097_003776, partial [Rhizopus azygosporus]